MASKSICDKCKHRWSSAGKLFCTVSQFNKCSYSNSKKECSSFEPGRNDKYWRGKNGTNRVGRCW